MSYKRNVVFALPLLASGPFDMADSTTYYMGNSVSSPSVTEGSSDVPVPVNGTVIGVIIWFRVGTVGSNEATAIYIRKNKTSDTLIGNADFSLAGGYYMFKNSSPMNVPVLLGDDLQVKIVTPAWVTNPLQMRPNGIILISTGH